MNQSLLETALHAHRVGNLAEAGRLYVEILRADPRHFEALYRLGLLQYQIGRFSESERLFAAAIGFYADVPELFCGRGCALQAMRRFEEALASFARALALRPNYPEARNNRGVTLLDMKRYQEALATFEMLEAANDHERSLIFNNRAAALLGLKRYAESLAYAEQSLSLNSQQANFFSTYGAILMALGRHEDALVAYDSALRLNPNFLDALKNRGSALRELKRFDEALASYDRALTIKPDFAEALNNRGLLRLLVGRYREGWLDHEWRWETDSITTTRPRISARPWQGEDLTGRRIVVYSEQGLGDIIHFARYLPLLVRRGAKVTFGAPENLIRLLGSLPAEIRIISSIDEREPFDFQCALMSLPLWFGTELHSIPNEVPYLKADDDLAARWKKKLGGQGFKVGIAWQGAPGRAIDQGRSIPLAEFFPLARIRGVRLFSLQKTHGLDQLEDLPEDVKIKTFGDDFDGGPDAFVDTAAVMAGLDLIVTSDTSVAHLAGALGRPTWVALKHVPDWRWQVDRDDNPWYPTLRLFRQETAGDWRHVFSSIERELRSAV